ncbi:MAG: response regulator [bacterium]|nr:response regulator [bacterium]
MNSLILLVDDEPTFISQLSLFLTSRGFQVISATDAESALRIIRHEPVAVVLADQQMPTIKGVDLLEAIRKEKPDIVRVLITGYSDLGVVIEAVNRGSIYRYIPKKILPEEIALAVRQCLEKYRQEAEIKRLSKANRRLLRRLAAEENLSAMGIFGREISQKLEEVVLGLSGYLFRDAGSGDNKKIRDDFKFLDLSLRRIRELSDISLASQEGKQSVCQINSLIEKELIRAERSAHLQKRAFTLETKLDSELPDLMGKEENFRRLFKEIIENAVLFSSGNRGPIFVSTASVSDPEDPRMEITIKNKIETGKTIEPRQFFAPFYTSLGRVASPDKEQIEIPEGYNLTPYLHFGIGLPMARWLASQQGGEIVLIPEKDFLTARITLPYSAES